MNDVSIKVKEFKSAREALSAFDLSCWFPNVDADSLGNFKSKKDIIERTKEFGIKKAVFSTMEALEISPIEGNELLIKEIKDYDFCYIAPILAPDMDRKNGDIKKYLDYYKKNKMVAVRMFPKTLLHSMKNWCVGNILSELEKRGIPLILWHTEIDWDTVAEIAAKYPKLIIVMEAIEKKLLYHARNILKLMETYPNIYFGTYNFTEYELINETEKTNNTRLIFASNYPVSDPNVSFGIIIESDLSQKSKEMICHGVLDDVLKNMK